MLRQTILYLPAQLLGPLAMFVAAIVWTHLLDAPTYGIVSYVLALQELIYGPTLGWWSVHALRFRGAAEAERRDRLVRSDAAVVFVAALVQIVGTWPILWILGIEVTPAFVAATALLFATRSLLSHYSEIARAEEAIGTYTVAQLAGPLAGTLASYAGVMMFGASPTAAIVGIAAAQTLGLAWTLVRLGVRPRPGAPARDLVAEAISYGGPIILAGICGWVSMNAIRLIVDGFAGAEALGLVSVGWGLGSRVASVAAMSLTAAAFPLAVRAWEKGDRSDALDQLALNGSMLFGLLAPTAVGVTLVADRLVGLTIAEPFRAATVVILPLSVLAGALRNQRVHHFDQAFLLTNQTSRLIGFNLIEAIATTVGTAIGLWVGTTQIGGLVGATLGGLAGTVIGAGVTAVYAIRDCGLRPQWSAWARILVAAGAMAGALAFVDWGYGVGGLVAEIVVGMAVYAAALLVLFPALAELVRVKLATRLRRRATDGGGS